MLKGLLRELNFLLDSSMERPDEHGFVLASWYPLGTCPLLSASNERQLSCEISAGIPNVSCSFVTRDASSGPARTMLSNCDDTPATRQLSR